jgi:hypothetical protein
MADINIMSSKTTVRKQQEVRENGKCIPGSKKTVKIRIFP